MPEKLSRDMKDLVEIFNARRIQYLIPLVGLRRLTELASQPIAEAESPASFIKPSTRMAPEDGQCVLVLGRDVDELSVGADRDARCSVYARLSLRPAIGHDDARRERAGRRIAPGARDDSRDRSRRVRRAAVGRDGNLVASDESAAAAFLAGALDAGHDRTSSLALPDVSGRAGLAPVFEMPGASGGDPTTGSARSYPTRTANPPIQPGNCVEDANGLALDETEGVRPRQDWQ